MFGSSIMENEPIFDVLRGKLQMMRVLEVFVISGGGEYLSTLTFIKCSLYSI